MKNLFWGIALLLATTAAAQPQAGNQPVMCIDNPDLLLELKHRVAPPVPSAEAEFSGLTKKIAQDAFANYLQHLAELHACCPNKYTEEMWYLHGADLTFTKEELTRLVEVPRFR
ncbi:MAG: hypothetical protein RIC19_11055 [Phaeodactylibacter sp.]|uniref:hypothetical protein n=1 Tax=Phaeodactylibacter sp. TaxID=1940289 RepID=UPI0032EEE779